MEDTIADLDYIAGYAQMIRTQLIGDASNRSAPITIGYVNRMVELTEKVRRSLDSTYEEWYKQFDKEEF